MNGLSPDEVKGLRVGLRHYVEKRFEEMEKSIASAKTELEIRLLSIKDWREATTERLRENEKRLQAVEAVAALFKYIAGVVVVLVLGLIWAVLTHTVELLPK